MTITIKVLPVHQPMGDFFVGVLPANLLTRVGFSDTMSAHLDSENETYKVNGTQRVKRIDRLKKIAEYINRSDAAFPNTIILSANFTPYGLTLDELENQIKSDEFEYEDFKELTTKLSSQDFVWEELKEKSINYYEDYSWKVFNNHDGTYDLQIPSNKKLAAVIDGQHRLMAFEHAKQDEDIQNMQLVCSIYLDLPKALQAQIFAVINSTQKPVDKSLTYNLYGYNIEEEDEIYWSPDKLAVFLTRKLMVDENSALNGRIKIAATLDDELKELSKNIDWQISTAVVVQGILKLISSNPIKDSNEINRRYAEDKPTRAVLKEYRRDKSPLRTAYIDVQDKVIYLMVRNFLTACNEIFWSQNENDTFIKKTVGIQALFDILKLLAAKAYELKDIRVSYFKNILEPASVIDFNSTEYNNASGAGRSKIRRSILEHIDIQ
ncbi:DGQHR domain-containing protein [Acinetobacter piscicola]|uniref:DGQHR domain-containing protein n=1 Tax=Acinetobacter piscicola TaxID=2006115 RepID=UPI001020CB51|nr:DGQHR domain-containing protein [Acinetobacter piscicola]RYL29656.1 DGQHR domain-containing protein [Acinetobacter piscicola]